MIRDTLAKILVTLFRPQLQRSATRDFLRAFEAVFDEDWEYSKEALGIYEAPPSKDSAAQPEGPDDSWPIAKGGTFLHPRVSDEIDDWGNRGKLLAAYRELKRLI